MAINYLRERRPRQIAGLAASMFAAALTLATAARPAAAPLPHAVATAAMEKFLARPSGVHGYRAARRLEATARGHRGWLDVQTALSPDTGLHYEVTAEGGSGYIRTRVLRSLLDEERRLVAEGKGGVSLSPENYKFSCEGVDENGFAVVALTPLRKDRALVDGHMLLTPDGDLVRLEGRLAKNPSFWVTRADIVRLYRRINGALVPVSLQTTAQLRLLGASTLQMTYRYSHIDEQPVDFDEPMAPPPFFLRIEDAMTARTIP
ncbi:MAG: hypothetical protein AB7Q29_01250 [Vicinamibacterales bacterium]